GALTVSDADARVADRRRQDDEGWHALDARPALLRQHRAVVRILLTAAEEMAGLHHLLAGLVDRRFLVMDRANDGVVLGAPGHEREMLADLDAGHVGLNRSKRTANHVGSGRFQVPGVELTGPTDEEEKDTVDVLFWTIGVQVR